MTLIVGTKDIARLRREGIARANAAAGAARGRYITIAPGQEMVYLAKEAEGQRYLAAHPNPYQPASDLSPYPFIAAELGITAADPFTLSQIWVQGAAFFRAVGSQIETVRLSTIAAISAAPSRNVIEGALEALDTAFAALPAPPDF